MMRHFYSYRILPALILGLSILFSQPLPARTFADDQVSRHLVEVIQTIALRGEGLCRKERLCGTATIPLFYQRRDFEPAWQFGGRLLPQAYDLIEALKQAEADGLHSSDYHIGVLDQMVPFAAGPDSAQLQQASAELLANIDLLLTDAFFLFAAHLLSGRIDPETIYPEWEAFHPTADLADILEHAIHSDDIAATLNRLAPPHAAYRQLKRVLKQYRDIAAAGGWPAISIHSKALRIHDRDPDVIQLRRRLALLDAQHLSPDNSAADVFDDQLEQLVIFFQKTHGLIADGIVGTHTLNALNIPVFQRIRQIELNLERWRWLPRHLGDRHIRVNIADYTLTAVENSAPVLNMRIVAGKPYWQTPVFSGKMSYMVVNPYWNIPPKIAIEDILPKLRNNSRYLDEQNIAIFENWQEDAPEIDSTRIDWSTITASDFSSYRLRQAPGPLNSLGRFKFIFPNKYAVYLHDTPSKQLFKLNSRSFSHGCIRLEKPVDLACWILKDNPQWSYEAIIRTVDSDERKIITIQQPVEVHIVYWTAWVDEKGALHFRDDIYHRDRPLDRALRMKRAESNKRKKSFLELPIPDTARIEMDKI